MSVASPHFPPLVAESFAGIFPLPLTPFEAFMVTDTRPDSTMLCDMELQFRGAIDRTAFDAALAFALSRNPLFTCLVALDANGAMVWIPSESRPAVDWAPWGVPLDDSYGRFTDLFSELGLRVHVRQGDDRSTVLLHFHHACSDGIGGLAFIEDLLAGYANAVPGAEPIEPRALEPQRLVDRGTLGLTGRSLWRKFIDSLAGTREGAKFMGQRPVALAPGKKADSASSESPRPTFKVVQCSQEMARGLRAVATSAGATVNDVLMRDLFITLRRWNLEHEPRSRRRRLRVLMPQNLRAKEDRAMPAANAMSFAFVTRAPDWCDRPDALLASLQEETEAVRKGQLSLYFTGALASLQSAGLLGWLLRQRFCFATAILTNLGDPLRRFSTKFPRSDDGLLVGNVVFRGLGAVPPLRPQTRAAFCIINAANDLAISFKWDPESFSPLDAERLLGHYVAQLETTAFHAASGLPVT